MADPVDILVEVDPSATQQQGDWIVKVGAGRGGSIVSRHRLKSNAIAQGRVEGRKRADTSRGAVLKVQAGKSVPKRGIRGGTWRTESRYGPAQQRGNGFLGLF